MKSALQDQKREHRITIKILYFAHFRDLVGGKHCEEMRIAERASVQDLLSAIAKTYPSTNRLLQSISVSINCRIVNRDALLNNDDEVALLPPIAGG